MALITALLFFLAGLALAVKGADLLVEGAASLSKKLAIPEIVIGLTIIAFGTSSPELIINIYASLAGKNEIVLGSILGSNTFNILAVLGISALIYPLAVQKNTAWKEIPFALLGGLLLILFAFNDFLVGPGPLFFALWEGILLIVFFLFFLVYTFGLLKTTALSEQMSIKDRSLKLSIFLLLLGFTGLFLGGKWVVDYAGILAREMGVSEKLISLTLLSLGTSFPELMTALVAAAKKRSDLAIGSIVGSNIFNLYFILGLSALIRPIEISGVLILDLWVMTLASFLLFLAMFTGKKRKLGRFEAIGFLIFYVGYLIYIIIRK